MTEPFHVRQAREKRGRRVVQIAEVDSDLLALCDDGTIWRREHDGGWNWSWQQISGPPAKDDRP